MDNPISWGVLCVVVVYFAIRFFNRAIAELENNKKENESYFD